MRMYQFCNYQCVKPHGGAGWWCSSNTILLEADPHLKVRGDLPECTGYACAHDMGLAELWVDHGVEVSVGSDCLSLCSWKKEIS